MGKQNNQQFVQMPLARLIGRIKQLCEIYGIRYVETEEANTSAASYLDGDSLPEHGETALKEGFPPQATANPKGKKPQGWKASGKRTKRGLYRTKNNILVNADLNGAANILKKVAGNLGIDLSRLGRRCLTSVARVRLWQGIKKCLSPSAILS